jgi:CheY-like chemotaxis protein
MDDQNADPVVLLVDDDEMERFLHRQALEPGFEIVDAEGGVAALEAFAISLPDVVVLDPMMPDMDGFAVCRAIRAGSNIPIPWRPVWTMSNQSNALSDAFQGDRNRAGRTTL